MLSIRDCLDYCDLTDDEIDLIAEHEDIPDVAAAQLVCGMVQTGGRSCPDSLYAGPYRACQPAWRPKKSRMGEPGLRPLHDGPSRPALIRPDGIGLQLPFVSGAVFLGTCIEFAQLREFGRDLSLQTSCHRFIPTGFAHAVR